MQISRYIFFYIFHHDTSHHDTMFAQLLCQCPCIYSINSRNIFLLQPVAQTTSCIPVAIFMTVITYNDCICMNTFTLHKFRQTIGTESPRRNTIISYQRISQYHQLTGIRRIGQTFRITCHGCVKHDLTAHWLFSTKRKTMKYSPVIQD